MTTRRILLAALAVAPMLFGTAAGAAEMAYTPAAFEAAQKAGKPILVHITAPWCTTCAAQKPILSKLEADPKFKDLQVFDVDFDSRKDVVKRFGATMQSTLITFKGEKETGRSAGETKPEAISSLLDKAI
ncbi:thioredoxin family protein [Methylobacterium sp. WL120]|uniref:thioredoxin family protein n=1 Tax=Methylobacterium sp. WL120 TaxID=2603887 RepID=UPI0011C77817|nr:thioredoxin family protein [Methylobacterium sp. WL120]TXM70706.1 thioredoxin family protein [Methylobacterium sp. WL120]